MSIEATLRSLDLAAERAYSAFIASAKEYLPPGVPAAWGSLPDAVRRAWIAAAAAALRNDDAAQS